VATLLAVTLAGRQAGALGTGAEEELGRRFFLSARSQLPLVDDPAVSEYVEGLGRKLVATLGSQPFEYRFFVVRSPALNAFAVPGGYVFVFTGLLARTETDDQLAAVLAHEIGHVSAHHTVRQQQGGQVWNYAALLGALLTVVNPVLGVGAMAAAQSAQLKYSREFEQEADYLGLRYTTQAGYDPRALAGFFNALLAEGRVNPAGVPAYMLTHPLTETRVAHVDTIISAQGLKTPPGRPAGGPTLAEVRAVARAMGEPPEVVLEHYRGLAGKSPDDAEGQCLLGRVQQTLGRLEAARTALERCRELGGLDGRVDRPLGTVYVALNEPAKAQAALERHLARHPGDARARLELGRALGHAGDTTGALRELQRALALDAELPEAHRLTGLAFGRQGNQAEGFYHLAQASLLRGDLEQALGQFQRTGELLDAKSPRRREVEAAIDELRPLVGDRERERRESEREGRRLTLP
jgi:predicted Zn-dependent protease